MLPRFVTDLAKATHFIPLFRASLRQCVLLCLVATTAFAQIELRAQPSVQVGHGLSRNVKLLHYCKL